MRYFPISIDLKNRPVLVVGGAEVAERRIDALLECDAKITVVSPEVSERIAALAAAGDIALHRRPSGRGDTEGMMLVLTATDEPRANAAVWDEARGSGVLVNTADEPSRCDFIIPAVVRRGALSVAISTGGTSPALAARLRQRLSEMLGPEYARLLDALGRWRPRLEERFKDPGRRKRLHYRIVDSDVLNLARDADITALDRRLEQIVEEAAEAKE